MGEYANYLGRRVKIGTCEDMLYLRWDQRHLVTEPETPLFDPKVLAVIRFRFPFPDEDNQAPGDFEAFRGLALWGFQQPKDMEHGNVQFSARNGYLVSLPCPESDPIITAGGAGSAFVIHRNGYGGPASLVGQAWRGGRLVGIARCNGCDYPYRLEDGYEEAAAVVIRAEADRKVRDFEMQKARGVETLGDLDTAHWYHEIADRLLAGYALTVPA